MGKKVKEKVKRERLYDGRKRGNKIKKKKNPPGGRERDEVKMGAGLFGQDRA
jgi:hypothetical protein